MHWQPRVDSCRTDYYNLCVDLLLLYIGLLFKRMFASQCPVPCSLKVAQILFGSDVHTDNGQL
jgi:hypothetical protein